MQPNERRPRPARTGRGRGCGPARGVAPRRLAEQPTSSARRAPRGRRPSAARAVDLACRRLADAPYVPTGERVQERELVAGAMTRRPSGLAVRPATSPSHACCRTPTVTVRPASLAHVAPHLRADPASRIGVAAQVQERLLHRAPLDSAPHERNAPKTPGSPRRRRRSARARPPRAGTAGAPCSPPIRCARRAPSPRSWRPARPRGRRARDARAGAGCVALLHGREERVDVGVEDRARHERMFVSGADGTPQPGRR